MRNRILCLLALVAGLATVQAALFPSGTTTVASVASLASLGTNAPSVVEVQGTLGGKFERAATGTYTVDSGVVYAGTGCQWVRQSWLQGEPVQFDWFATGDGVTSDRDAFLRAMTNVMAGASKTLQLGAKTYSIGGPNNYYTLLITNWHKGLIIEGIGTNSVFRCQAPIDPDTIFRVDEAGTVTFRNLTLDGNCELVQSEYHGRCLVSIYGNSDVTFDRVLFKDFYDKGILPYNAAGKTVIQNCEFTGHIYEANGAAIYTGSTNAEVYIHNNYFHDLGGWKWFIDLGATKPNDGDVITCTGETTRTFRTAPTDPATEILIGATAAETETNVVNHLVAYPFTNGRVNAYFPLIQVGITFRSQVVLACNAATAVVTRYKPPQCLYGSRFKTCDVRGNRFVRAGCAADFRFSQGVAANNYVENDSRLDVDGSPSFNFAAGWDGYHPIPPSRCQFVGNTIVENRATYAFGLDSSSNHVIMNNVVLRPWIETNTWTGTSRFLYVGAAATNCVVSGNTFQPTISSRAALPAFVYLKTTNVYNLQLGENALLNCDIIVNTLTNFYANAKAVIVTGAQKCIGKNQAITPYTMMWAVGSSGATNTVINGIVVENQAGVNFPYWQLRSENPASTDYAPNAAQWINPFNGSRWLNLTNNGASHSVATVGYWIGDRYWTGDPNTLSYSDNQGSQYLDRTTGSRWLKTTTNGSSTGWAPYVMFGGTAATAPTVIYPGMLWISNSVQTFISPDGSAWLPLSKTDGTP